MIRELILSVASGVIVALILQIFRGRGRDTMPLQNMRNYNYAPPRRRSFFGRLVRLILSVAGGIIFAQSVAPFVLSRRFDRFDRYSRFDGIDGLSVHVPVLVLTAIGTIVIWMFLSALTRR